MCDRTEGGSSADRLTSSSPASEAASPSAPDARNDATSPQQQQQQHRCNCSSGNSERPAPPGTSYSSGWRCEDDPPPYASLIDASPGHHRVAWSYVFPGLPGYEAAAAAGAGSPGAATVPSGNGNRTIARPLVSIPLTSYGIFKIEPPRYAAAMRAMQPQMEHPRHLRMMAEPGPAVKSSTGTARKYGAILIAATVIIFLMALSLMVRFVTEKSLWKG